MNESKSRWGDGKHCSYLPFAITTLHNPIAITTTTTTTNHPWFACKPCVDTDATADGGDGNAVVAVFLV